MILKLEVIAAVLPIIGKTDKLDYLVHSSCREAAPLPRFEWHAHGEAV